MERFWQFRFLMIKSLGSTLGALVFVFSMGLPSLSAAGESCVLLLGGKPRLSFKNPPAPNLGDISNLTLSGPFRFQRN
jgi:hypothetical protein